MEEDKRIESLYYSELFGVFLIVGINRFHYAYCYNDPKGFAGIIELSRKDMIDNLKKMIIEQKFEYLGKL